MSVTLSTTDPMRTIAGSSHVSTGGRNEASWSDGTGAGAGAARKRLAEHRRQAAFPPGSAREDRLARLLDLLLYQLPARARRAAAVGTEVRRCAGRHRGALAKV